MQFITVTHNINFKNPVYGEGTLLKGKTYYTFGQFARETVKQGFATPNAKVIPTVLQFNPSHLKLTNKPQKILIMFSGGLGDAVSVGIVLPLVKQKYNIFFDICCDRMKWDYIFQPMGLTGKHIFYPPDLDTIFSYDAILVDITHFFYSNDGLKVSPVVQLLQGFKVEDKHVNMHYKIPQQIRNKHKIASSENIKIGVNLDSNGLVKSYPEKLHKRLLHALRKTGFEIYILGKKGFKEQGYALDGVFDFRGKTTIPEMIALLDQMDIVLGVDSFIVHLSNILKIKTIVLLSTTSPSYFKWHKHITCLASRLECAPCFAVFDQCPNRYPECLAFEHKSMLPNTVSSFAERLLRNCFKTSF